MLAGAASTLGLQAHMVQILKSSSTGPGHGLDFYKIKDGLQLRMVFSVKGFIKWGSRIWLLGQTPCNYADACFLCGACACRG